MAVLAVDMGGTGIRTAVFRSPEKMESSVQIPVRQWGFPVPPDEFVEHIADQASSHQDIEAVGVGLAAVVDQRTGHVKVGENIGWHDVPLRDLLETRLQRPVCVDVDAFCGTMAEARLGSGVGADSFLYVVIGTGIGHGLMLNGKLWHGHHAAANVFGHLKVVPQGAPCYCGGRGCLCQYSSGEGLTRLGRQYCGDGPPLTGQSVLAAYRNGEDWAATAVDEALTHLATAISHVYNLLDIERIVIGGGAVTELYPDLERLRRLIAPLVYPQIRPIVLRNAALGSTGVLRGAALLALEMVSNA